MTSDERAFNTLYREYSTVVDVLATIALRDEAFERYISPQVSAHALKLYLRMSSKHFLSLFHFELDVLHILTPFSLYLQKSSGVMMDKAPYVDQVRRDLLRLKVDLGVHLYTYLTAVVYDGAHGDIEGIPEPTLLEQYDHYDGMIRWKGIDLEDGLINPRDHNRNHNQNFPPLSTIFEAIVDKYITQINHYFPPDEMIHYDKFNPKTLPVNPLDTPLDYGFDAIDHFSLMYGWAPEQLKLDFKIMLNAMQENQYLQRRRNDPPHVFWLNALLSDELSWTPNLVLLIRTLLVHAHGTQDVERILSMQRKIDTEFRVNMKIDSIRALLRLRFHGVDIGEFKDRFSVKIATKWIRDGHMKTDDPRQPRGKNRGEPKSVNRFLPSTFFY
jgi:hypothetical protein